VGHLAAIYAIADEDLQRENEQKTSAVHFLRFEFDPRAIAAFRDGSPVAVGIDHPNYSHRIDALLPDIRAALARDFMR
jgi:hypothetical protein